MIFELWQNGIGDDMDEDSFFELLTRFQSRRIDDQRCSFRLLESASVTAEHTSDAKETKNKELPPSSGVYTSFHKVCLIKS